LYCDITIIFDIDVNLLITKVTFYGVSTWQISEWALITVSKTSNID